MSGSEALVLNWEDVPGKLSDTDKYKMVGRNSYGEWNLAR
jgi:hypothetical protein